MLLVVQLVLVLSIAAKYVYERKVCPRVWVRTAQIDPDLPLSRAISCVAVGGGRMFASSRSKQPRWTARLTCPYDLGFWRWRVKPEAKVGEVDGGTEETMSGRS